MNPFPLPDDDAEKPKPQPQAERTGTGDGSAKPPRLTAIGQGGPDDEDVHWEEQIADLRRYDLEALEVGELDPETILSWPMPGLKFIKVDPLPAVLDVGKRITGMEDVLSALNGHKGNFFFSVISSKSGVNYYMGSSVPGLQDTEGEESSNILQDTLKRVYGLKSNPKELSSDTLGAMTSPLLNQVGIVTGIPSLKSVTIDSDAYERLSAELEGRNFGIMVLAVPIPAHFVTREEFHVVDMISRATEQSERVSAWWLELQEAYLNHVRLGTAIGSWQVCVYFFAPDHSTFARLQSFIHATYNDESSSPTPLRTHKIPGMKAHAERFGLLRNTRADQNTQSLLSYRFLTPLNSRSLSAYVQVPNR